MDMQTTRGAGFFLVFTTRPIQDKVESEKAGRPIFKEVDYVEVHFPGDKNTVHVAKAQNWLAMRPEGEREVYQAQYEKWKQTKQQSMVGTPLEQWPALSVSQVAELKALSIMTVEQLADLNDTGLSKIGIGGRQLQAKARAYLDAAKSNAGNEKLAADYERLKENFEALQEQVRQISGLIGKSPEEIAAFFEAGKDEGKRKPGRPAKAA